MLLPGGVGEHLQHHFAQRLVLGAADPVQQAGQAQTGCGPANMRQVVLDMSIAVMQFEDELVTTRHVRSKKAVPSFNPGAVEIGRERFSHRAGQTEILTQRDRRYFRSLTPVLVQRMRKAGITLSENPKRLLAGNRYDKNEME